MSQQVDVLAFAAHPDDVELSVAGTMLRLKQLGYRTGIVDFTRGENSTRGNPDLRAEEVSNASNLLGLDVRECLEFPDTGIMVTDEARQKVVEVVRKYRPVILIAPFFDDLHPDHQNAGRIVADSYYLTGIGKYSKGEPHRPKEVLFYFAHLTREPHIVVDISDLIDEKMEVVKTYASQLFKKDSTEPPTLISRESFLERLRARARFFGHKAGVEYGEGFFLRRPVPVKDPVALWSDR